MRVSRLVAALGALGLAGCAASPANRAAGPVPASAQAAGGTHAQEESPDHRVARQSNRALGWVVLSVGAEAAVVATITSSMMLHQNGIRSDDCVDKVCSAAGLAANETLHNLEWWNAGAWVVAVAGVGVGAIVLWTNPSDAALHAEVGIAPTGPGSSVLLRGDF
jgi:hypothetical protein